MPKWDTRSELARQAVEGLCESSHNLDLIATCGECGKGTDESPGPVEADKRERFLLGAVEAAKERLPKYLKPCPTCGAPMTGAPAENAPGVYIWDCPMDSTHWEKENV